MPVTKSMMTCVLACLVSCTLACESNAGAGKDKSSGASAKSMTASAMQKTAVAVIAPSKAATTQPTLNNVTGSVTFTQTAPDTLMVAVMLTGLTPNTRHGFHIHEKSDLSAPDLSSAGAHFNPAGHKHGGPESAMAHAGDLGNVASDAQGNVKTQMTIKGVNLDSGAPNCVLGRTVLVHAKEDDLKTDPSGNSGGRIAGGVIEMAK